MKVAQEPPPTLALTEQAPPSLTVEEIRALAQVAREFDLSELDLRRPSGERLRLRRGLTEPAERPAAPARVPEAAPAPPVPEQAAAAAPVAEDRDARVVTITSPFVGTFYRSAGPEASAFVDEGQRVRKGQTLCIIEAMKLMNELESEVDGVIVRCLADNGRPVEYGEPLFKIRAG